MLKSRLQEYTQKQKWLLPEYATFREGPDHGPRFKAEVIVNGVTFRTPAFAKSAKEAQVLAAELALEHFTESSNLSKGLPTEAPSTGICKAEQVDHSFGNSKSGYQGEQVAPSFGDSQSGSQGKQVAPSFGDSHSGSLTEHQTSLLGGSDSEAKDEERFQDPLHFYKSELLIYAQNKKVALPEYINECDGPPHARRFKSRVMIEGISFDSTKHFSSLKGAEKSAARAAFFALSPNGVQTVMLKYSKNLLQEFVQKEYSSLPTYSTDQLGEPNLPMFVSTVEVHGEVFEGEGANSKKLAEQNAARVAYSTLMERKHKPRRAADDKHVIVSSAEDLRDATCDAQPTLEVDTVVPLKQPKYSNAGSDNQSADQGHEETAEASLEPEGPPRSRRKLAVTSEGTDQIPVPEAQAAQQVP